VEDDVKGYIESLMERINARFVGGGRKVGSLTREDGRIEV
jgi:hypothetical protein